MFAEQPGRTFARGLVLVGASTHGNPEAVAGITAGGWLPELVALQHVASDDPEYWRSLRQRLAKTWAEDLRLAPDALGRIGIPVLAINGERDRIEPPATARAIAAAIPDAEAVVIEGAGHLAQRDRPADFNQATAEFLERRIRPAMG